MATLTTYRTEVASVIGLDTTNSAELALIDQWVNEGVSEVVSRTGCKVTTTTISLTAGTTDYTLSTSIMSIIDGYVTSSGNTYSLIRTTPDDILNLRRNSASSGPGRLWYAVAGANLLMVYPSPASSSDTITVYYVPRPATLTNGSDTPSEIPTEFHRVVTLYAKARAADYDDDQSSAQGERYRKEYEDELKLMRRAISRKGGHRLAPALVPPSKRRRIVSASPSASPWIS